MIIVLGEKNPGLELFQRFWLKKFKYDVCFPCKVTAILDEMGIRYSKEIHPLKVDLTNCFQDDFKKPNQHFILDIFTQVDTHAYPEEIVRTCIDYLHFISQEEKDTKARIVMYGQHYFEIYP